MSSNVKLWVYIVKLYVDLCCCLHVWCWFCLSASFSSSLTRSVCNTTESSSRESNLAPHLYRTQMISNCLKLNMFKSKWCEEVWRSLPLGRVCGRSQRFSRSTSKCALHWNTFMSILIMFITSLAKIWFTWNTVKSGAASAFLDENEAIHTPNITYTFIQIDYWNKSTGICTKPKRSKKKPKHSRTQDRLQFHHFFPGVCSKLCDKSRRPAKNVFWRRSLQTCDLTEKNSKHWLKQLGNLYRWRWQAATSYSSGF